ncbi:uncharacterized protein PWA37_000847 [Arxiozyma heterogenica]|uniref:Uncharacterized protein n=1 Tax=Arxiozyma heterogenica TaxID=278026 RepID=A0AAN7WMW9_9SACH|nr:hypothetical protein RI543_000658 [Kazachstania heterogenica]
MFSNFSLDKLTSTITTAAQSAQETINNTILSPNVQTKLQIKKTTRFLQEKVGAIPEDEISKLPEDYQQLELKVDALEKVLNRLLLVTRTFELEGYDYPPNLTESLNHWWNEQDQKVNDFKNNEKESKDFENAGSKETSNAVNNCSNDKLVEINSSIFNRSFAIAISKAVLDSQQIFINSKKRKEQTYTGDSKTNNEEDEEDEEDEDLNNLIKAFQSWCQCYKNIDQSQNDMNTMIVKEFNQKLSDMLAIDFKTVKKLRKKVQESRLEFDTMRHEIKMKNSLKEKAKEESIKVESESEKEIESENKDTANSKEQDKGNITEKEQQEQKDEKEEEEEEEEETEEDKLLEQLEDDFVSNITAAAEKMTELTDSVELISLVKLFQNIQLVHYRQCVQELETSMKLLDTLTINDDDE